MKRNSNKIRLSKGDILFHVINYTFFFLFTLMCVYPFWFIIINSVSDGMQVDLGRVLIWPIGFHLENYKNIFALQDIYDAALISVLRTLLGTAFTLFCTTYAAYFFTKQNMWHHKLCYRFVIATMYFSAGLIPGYMNIKSLGLLNNFAVYIVPSLIATGDMVLIKTYMESIPPSMEESAQIDGAGILRRLFFIVMPLSVPILATIALFTAVNQWNSFTDTLLYITNEKLYTLQYILQLYFKKADAVSKQMASGTVSASAIENISASLSSTSIKLTITVVVTLPIMCVYPFVQKYFIKGIMIGAVKG